MNTLPTMSLWHECGCGPHHRGVGTWGHWLSLPCRVGVMLPQSSPGSGSSHLEALPWCVSLFSFIQTIFYQIGCRVYFFIF